MTANHCERNLRELAEAREELSSIHRWIERNHADGFIDSLTYSQNLDRVTDNWYDRIDAIEKEARELLASEKITRNHVIKRGIEMQKERGEAHKIAERAIDDLAWFSETNAQRLRDELNQLKEETK